MHRGGEPYTYDEASAVVDQLDPSLILEYSEELASKKQVLYRDDKFIVMDSFTEGT